MKAVVLERRGGYAAVLCEDGTFIKTRGAGEIGETIELKAGAVALPAKNRNRWMRNAVAAALVLAVTGSTLGYTTASAYVSLDVEDASIELTVNHFGRVIAVNALSEGTEELAESLSGELKHQKAKDALGSAVERLRGEDRASSEGDAVIAGIASDNGKCGAALARVMENTADGEHTLYVSEVSRAERREAMERKVSAGRFGFERDHGNIATADRDAAGQKNETGEQMDPAAPAGGTENETDATPQPAGRMAPGAPRQDMSGEQPDRRPEQPRDTARPEQSLQDDGVYGSAPDYGYMGPGDAPAGNGPPRPADIPEPFEKTNWMNDRGVAE